MNFIELEVESISHGVSNNNTYILVLSEKIGGRKLMITIGPAEAQSIAIMIEQYPVQRPFTHDLMKNIIEELGGELVSITIDKVFEGKYYSFVNVQVGDSFYSIDSRTSDAVALAMRFECPIYTNQTVMDDNSISLEYSDDVDQADEDELVKLNSQSRKLDDLPLKRLEKMMTESLSKEDYEEAAKIRDAIERKKNR